LKISFRAMTKRGQNNIAYIPQEEAQAKTT
jgi:hypothetical protein